MDFRKLNGITFKVWAHLCEVCKHRPGGVRELANRFALSSCSHEIARSLDYNHQTVLQALHTLQEANFLSEVKDLIDSRRTAYFMHVILMGEHIPLPANAESLAKEVFRQEHAAAIEA